MCVYVCVYMHKEGRLTGLTTTYIRTAFWNVLLKERRNERLDEEEDVSSYRRTLWKRKTMGKEKGNTTSHRLENWLWLRLQTCRKVNYVKMYYVCIYLYVCMCVCVCLCVSMYELISGYHCAFLQSITFISRLMHSII